MASNVTVGYEALQQASNQLSSGREELVALLKDLQSMIDSLTGSGFATRVASGRFAQHYRQWNQSTTQMLGSIDDIARAIREAQSRHQQADQTLAAAVGTAGVAGAGAAGAGAAVRSASSRGAGGGRTSSGSGAAGTAGAGAGTGAAAGGRRARVRQVKDPRFESVPSNQVNERLRQIDRSKSTGWGRSHEKGDRYAYDRVKLDNGQEATRTQGMQVTVDKGRLRTTARDTSPPGDLKSTMPGYRNADGTNNEMQLGHLWADRLGGPNAARNFVPVYPHINGGAMAYVEGRVADAVRQHGSVRLVALPNYVGNNVVPDSILYAWKVPGAESWTTVLIKNAPKRT